jgi:hypothetical protein
MQNNAAGRIAGRVVYEFVSLLCENRPFSTFLRYRYREIPACPVINRGIA